MYLKILIKFTSRLTQRQ